MYLFTQRLFAVPYEWRRLALILLSAAAIVAAGEVLLPTSGAIGLLSRGALWLGYPLVLLATGFLHPEERTGLGDLLRPSAIAARARGLRARPARGEPEEEERPGFGPEVYEAAARDEDRPGV
jgi:hypothetical protein